MSLLGSAFGRVLYGASQVANKYLDEELAQQRAQALADIQRRTRQLEREDADAFDNDPTRLARNRETRRQDALAAGRTAREVELEGLNDTTLDSARREKGDRDAADVTRRKVTEMQTLTPAEAARIDALAPSEAKRAGLIADAQGRAQAKYRQGTADPADGIQKKLNAIDKMDFLSPEEKLAAKKAVVGLGKGRDPELDYETIKRTTPDPDNPSGQIESTVKRVRRPGQTAPTGEAQDDPIKAAMDAARNKAKDGKATPPKAPAAESAPASPAPNSEAPKAPRLMDRARNALASSQASGQEYQAIYNRVREAADGGLPLTNAEKAAARKWRLPV